MAKAPLHGRLRGLAPAPGPGPWTGWVLQPWACAATPHVKRVVLSRLPQRAVTQALPFSFGVTEQRAAEPRPVSLQPSTPRQVEAKLRCFLGWHGKLSKFFQRAGCFQRRTRAWPTATQRLLTEPQTIPTVCSAPAPECGHLLEAHWECRGLALPQT